jgi:hypothetical protein
MEVDDRGQRSRSRFLMDVVVGVPRLMPAVL